MKKNLALIISVLLIISLFAGCGGSSMSADSAVVTPSSPGVRMNSACHAWSGTAAYFLRKGN